MSHGVKPVRASTPEIDACVQRLAATASVELNSMELHEFAASCGSLRAGQQVFVSHLPRQTWTQTLDICAKVSSAGFEPVPHIPVRLLEDEQRLGDVLGAAFAAGVREPLLLAGDYANPVGPFSNVLEVLRRGVLQSRGFTRVSFAGHPEGHPKISRREILQAQVDKWRVAADLGMQVTFVTQFFFAAQPFSQWACELRSAGVRARLVAGLAGPAGLTRLLRLARRCGVGPSMRALTSRPASMFGLLSDHDPDALLRDLAAEWQRYAGLLDGIHLFSFGGFARTVSWLRQHAPGDHPVEELPSPR